MSKRLKKWSGLLAAACISTTTTLPSAFAGNVTGTVTQVSVSKGGVNGSEGTLIFTMSGDKKNNPACSTDENGSIWAASLSVPSGRAMYSMVLYAMANEKILRIRGTGSCGAWPDKEEPSFMFVVG